MNAFAQSKSDLKEIQGVIAAQQSAWNRGDLDGFMAGYWQSDSLSFVGSKGVMYGWQATLDNYKKSYPSPEIMGKLNFTLLQIKPIAKHTVYVVGKWQLTRSVGDVGGHFTLVWQKIKGKWVIVSDHSS